MATVTFPLIHTMGTGYHPQELAMYVLTMAGSIGTSFRVWHSMRQSDFVKTCEILKSWKNDWPSNTRIAFSKPQGKTVWVIRSRDEHHLPQ